MSLLSDNAEPATWDAFRALSPSGAEAILGVERTMWDRVDPVLLELARLRIAQLLRAPSHRRSEAARRAGLTADKIAELSKWPTSGSFDDRERMCLALTEQYMIDVNGVSDEQVEQLLEVMSPAECHSFVSALWAFEQLQRIALVLGIDVPQDALEPNPS